MIEVYQLHQLDFTALIQDGLVEYYPEAALNMNK